MGNLNATSGTTQNTYTNKSAYAQQPKTKVVPQKNKTGGEIANALGAMSETKRNIENMNTFINNLLGNGTVNKNNKTQNTPNGHNEINYLTKDKTSVSEMMKEIQQNMNKYRSIRGK